MNIAFISDNFSYRGGNIKQIIELANHFSKKGNNVTLFASDYNPSKCFPEIEKKFKIKTISYNHSIPSIISNRITKISKMKNEILKDDTVYDFFIIHDAPYYMLSSFIQSKYSKSKLIWHMNDLPYIFDVLYKNDIPLPTKIISFILRKVDSWYINKFKYVTTLSLTTQRYIHELFNKTATVVNTGTDKFFLEKDEKRLPDTKKAINLLTVGAFYPSRRYEDIIQAIVLLQKNSKIHFHLNIIGYEGSAPVYANMLHKLIDKLNLRKDVIIKGSIDNSGLKEAYKNADIFIQSTDHIGWTIPATEAMLSGIPTIITNTCGLNEFVKDGIHCLIINPKSPKQISDNVTSLINDKEFYTKLSKQGKKYILENFIWEEYCRKIEKYLKNI